MRHVLALVLLSTLFTINAGAQTAVRRVVRADGEGVVTVRPDQARVSFAVVTTAQNANDAVSRNAAVSANVTAALRQLLGGNADIRTAGYNLSPNTNRDGQIIGYTVTNTIEATVADVNLAGRAIDAGVQAGATRVNSVRLSLRDPDPARAQALRIAGQKARAQAEAIALGLGIRIGQVLTAAEGGAGGLAVTREINLAPGVSGTVIESGTLEVRATVTVEFEIVL
jgi:uncharacterized protein YggE